MNAWYNSFTFQGHERGLFISSLRPTQFDTVIVDKAPVLSATPRDLGREAQDRRCGGFVMAITKYCQQCGTAFSVPPCRDDQAKFCSRLCHQQYLTEHYAKTAEARFWAKVVKGDGCWVWLGKPNKSTGYGEFRFADKDDYAHRVSYLLSVGAIPDSLFVLHRCDNRQCVRPDHLYLGTPRDNANDMVSRNRSAKGSRNGMHTHPERRSCGASNGAARPEIRRLLSEQAKQRFLERPESFRSGQDNGSYTRPDRRPHGESHGSAKVTEEQVKQIRQLAKGGMSCAKIAPTYGLEAGAVRCMVRRITWAHVE